MLSPSAATCAYIMAMDAFGPITGNASDTVGDPFKDIAGPSLHVLIQLLCAVTFGMAPLFL